MPVSWKARRVHSIYTQDNGMNLKNPVLWRVIALGGYFSTLFFVMFWVIWLAPDSTPRSVVLAIALLPMLLPLRGLLHGRRYTHAWASFLALPYFAFGVDAVVHRTQMKWLGAILVLLSALWFCGCMFYSRYHPQHQPVDSDTEH